MNEMLPAVPRKTRSQDKPSTTDPIEIASNVVPKQPPNVIDVDAPTIDRNDPINRATLIIHHIFPTITPTKSMVYFFFCINQDWELSKYMNAIEDGKYLITSLLFT